MQSLDHFKKISEFKICRYELRNRILSYDLKCFQKYSEKKISHSNKNNLDLNYIQAHNFEFDYWLF